MTENTNEMIEFADDEEIITNGENGYWSVLIVDDEPDVHSATEYALANMQIHGRDIEFSHAYSGKEALDLVRNPNTKLSVVIMDVVMESDDAGLKAVDAIRSMRHMDHTRIILRTGQPGQAPEIDTIRKYDINDYRTKSELTRSRLYAALLSAIKSYDQLEKLSAALANLKNLTFVDNLTGLETRYSIVQEIDEAIHAPEDYILVLIDLDKFSNINDIFGQDYGDKVLIEVGNKLKRAAPNSHIARLGKDLFAVLGLTTDVNPVLLNDEVTKPFTLLSNQDHTTQKLTAHMGAVFLNDKTIGGSSILKDAEVALEMAKDGGPEISYFTKESSARRLERVKMLHDLRTDFYAERLTLAYQPQYDLHSGDLIGAEALLRWTNRDGKNVPPDIFIPIAEQSKLINEIGEWVLKKAMRDLLKIQEKVKTKFVMAVNVSIGQFSETDFVSIVKKSLDDIGVLPNSIELEITESVASLKLSDLQDKLSHLRDIGVQTALDDFGTGFSSLSYLDTLKLDKLKIDKSFVKNIHQVDTRLVDLIIMIGVRFGMTVIAEGVESESDRDALISMGCDQAQGYFYSKPVPLPEFIEKFIENKG